MLLLLLRGKDETLVIEDLGSVLCDSSIQTFHLPTLVISKLDRKMVACWLMLLWGKDETPVNEDLGSVLRDSSIQRLRLPTILIHNLLHNLLICIRG